MMGSMVNLPAGHPATVLDDPDDPPRLVMTASGGQREYDTRTLRHWQVTAQIQHDYPEVTPNALVARMTAISVQPDLGDPWDDLDHIDGDAEALGSVFFEGQDRSIPFMDIAEGFGPVLLVSTYTVEPAWRRTPYSAFIAARMLNLFADTGMTAAALRAHPTGFDGPNAERIRVQGAIKRMWASIGFRALDVEPEFMAKALDPHESLELVTRLAAQHDVPWTASEI